MIGEMRHRVTLQSQVQTQDEIGQPSTAWLDVATVWADLRHLSGLQAIKSGMDVSTVKASARIRYRAVNAGQRLVYGTAVYNITAVLPDAKRTYVDLVCETVNVDA
jgi:SPP1 family predicted phage head-tail adaptor